MNESSPAIGRSWTIGMGGIRFGLAPLATAMALSGAVPLIAPSHACAGDPGKEEARHDRQRAKREGAVDPRFRAYYDLFKRGPALIPFHDTKLVPQGLTYWAARDRLIIGYYDAAHGRSRIAIVDRRSGRHITNLVLRTTGHVGGLGMTQSGHLWVATNGKLFRYPERTLDSVEGTLIDSDRTFEVKAFSFIGVRGNDLWVGQFARSGKPRAYPYRVTAKGDLQSAGTPIPVPTQTQGMAVTDQHFIFSRSFGRDKPSRIESPARRAPVANGPTLKAPSMAEGMVFAGGEIHVVYESGSKKYPDAKPQVRTIHHASVASLGG